ncbi:hypothetical protein [Sphaerisporangium aureirubrum]|uniref:Uncharacterized protein n=1 Tax=Sphaerisporangium aureirubrum TaxID=1544736 RepID=A0ABW1NI43_9ACTN
MADLAPSPGRHPGSTPAAVMIMGVHGVLRLKPWILQAHDRGDLEEDVFSLVVKRSVAYGWSSFNPSRGPSAIRWGHNDAGGDWRQDGRVRELAWLQADISVAAGPLGHRPPITPMATVLADTLALVGDTRLTALHTLIPLSTAPDARADLSQAAAWFALTDPTSHTDLTVTIRTTTPTDPSAIITAARDRTFAQMTVTPTSLPPAPSPPPTGGIHLNGLNHTHTFHCRPHEWSLNVASWTTEIFTDALRTTGLTTPALITVSNQAA